MDFPAFWLSMNTFKSQRSHKNHRSGEERCQKCGHRKSNCGCNVKQNVKVKVNLTGPTGHTGGTGHTGPTGPTGPGGMTLYLASAESVPNGAFIGLGTEQSGAKDFVRASVVIPQNATITGLVFSIRDNTLAAGAMVTAEIYTSTDCGVTPVFTGIAATVTGPNPPNCCVAVTAYVHVSQCDLLSVRIVTNNGALADGAAATILFSIPEWLTNNQFSLHFTNVMEGD